MSATLETDLKEMKDRLRRMETRFVQLAEHMGFDTERKLPKWRINAQGPEVDIPSTATSISDILAVIPVGHERLLAVAIVHKGKRLCWVEQT